MQTNIQENYPKLWKKVLPNLWMALSANGKNKNANNKNLKTARVVYFGCRKILRRKKGHEYNLVHCTGSYKL